MVRPPEMPEAAANLWNRLAKFLAINGRLQPEDCFTLEKLCRAVAMWHTAMMELETGKLVVELKTGVTAPNQTLKALEILDAQIERGIRHFGLSPATRGALKAANPDQEKEDFDDFLASRPESKPAA